MSRKPQPTFNYKKYILTFTRHVAAALTSPASTTKEEDSKFMDHRETGEILRTNSSSAKKIECGCLQKKMEMDIDFFSSSHHCLSCDSKYPFSMVRFFADNGSAPLILLPFFFFFFTG